MHKIWQPLIVRLADKGWIQTTWWMEFLMLFSYLVSDSKILSVSFLLLPPNCNFKISPRNLRIKTYGPRLFQYPSVLRLLLLETISYTQTIPKVVIKWRYSGSRKCPHYSLLILLWAQKISTVDVLHVSFFNCSNL